MDAHIHAFLLKNEINVNCIYVLCHACRKICEQKNYLLFVCQTCQCDYYYHHSRKEIIFEIVVRKFICEYQQNMNSRTVEFLKQIADNFLEYINTIRFVYYMHPILIIAFSSRLYTAAIKKLIFKLFKTKHK